ncbi:MAG: diacylglycerol kinase [Nitrosomonas sp.]|jgi:diacylglycerol kinase (ATP)|nr:MAG: diacylglycerol kinase [Nitrosomonas sp.]
MANQTRIDVLETGVHRTGILFNPLGGQARKRKKAIKQMLTVIPHAIYQEATNWPEFKASINSLLQAEINLLVIIGGDGTIHAILDLLFTARSPEKWPILAIIAGGTTNMTSLELGIRGKPERALQQLSNLLSQSQSLTSSLVRRPVLCIEQTGTKKNYGLFFGAGLIARGVKFSRSNVKQLGITGGIFTLFIMLRSLAGMLLGQHQNEWAPADIKMTDANGKVRNKTCLFALVSALDCLLLGIRPYWGKESAPLHVTMVDQQRRHLWRSLWPLLSGHGDRLKEQNGYHSQNVTSIELMMDDEYIVDGELYRATIRNGPLRISATDPVTFLVI